MKQESNSGRKILILGLDGLGWNLLDRFIGSGFMPYLDDLKNKGAWGDLKTVIPPLTPAAWASFMTGTNPGKHGIYDFYEFDSRDYRETRAVNSTFLNGKPVWNILGEDGKKTIVLNVPPTYPAYPVNGILISDHLFTPSQRPDSHPAGVIKEIEKRFGPYKLGFEVVYDKGRAKKAVDEYFEEIDYKEKVCKYLFENKNWDLFMVYIGGTDKLQHDLWHLLDDKHPDYNERDARYFLPLVQKYFRRLDEFIKNLHTLAGGKDIDLILLSDHGQTSIYYFFYPNLWLLENGFMKLRNTLGARLRYALLKCGLSPENIFRLVNRFLSVKNRMPLRTKGYNKLLNLLFLSFNDVDWGRTRAFAKGNFGQIYLNASYFENSDEAEREKKIAELEEKLKAFLDKDGRPVIDKVFRKEKLFSGPQVSKAPDISYTSRDFKWKPLGVTDFPSGKLIGGAFGKSGCHTLEGIFLWSGTGVRRNFTVRGAKIEDLCPSILSRLGCKIPGGLDGRVLDELFENTGGIPVSSREGRSAETPAAKKAYKDNEEEIIAKRLGNLGYI